MHPETLRSPSQAQQFHAPEINQDQYRSLSDTLSLSAEVSEEIRELAAGPRRGFGSVRVRVRVGTSTWTTSIFPDSGRGTYVLPIKRAVRKAEALDVGDVASVTVELIEV
jgi:hypothetical protein